MKTHSQELPHEENSFNKPWLVAVWPGMGQVAVSAGYYLVAKLQMELFAELSQHEFFDVEHVEVKSGLIKAGRLPRSRLFASKHPDKRMEIIVFIGEAQPPNGRYAYCKRLIDVAREMGIQRVFTFAAMATQMHPSHNSRVFGAAVDEASLDELKRLKVKILDDCQIGGLNGILLAAAAEQELRGTCLLGEIPHIFNHLPFPKASLAVLKVFSMIADIDIDTTELTDQVCAMDGRLGELLADVERMMHSPKPPDSEAASEFEPQQELGLEHSDRLIDEKARKLVERLFSNAQKDRSKAYELKHELDRLGLYQEYEDRFLDLFKNSA
ncbi:MAG: PAC2 family protein [Pirellulaceae bacterium]|nr:PAC2 family protein [Pirellulaceae bacterium]